MNLDWQLCRIKLRIYYIHESLLLKISHRSSEADFSISVVMLSNPFLNVWILAKTRGVFNKDHHNSSDHTQESRRGPTNPKGLRRTWRSHIPGGLV